MKPPLLELLAGSRLSWQVPELWEALCAGTPPPAGEALTAALLRRLANPLGASEVFSDLLERGEFTAAEQLAEEESFLAELGGLDLSRLHAEISAARHTQELKLQGRCDYLRRRASGLPVSLQEIDARLAAALELAAGRTAPAAAAIAEVERVVEALEDQQLVELRRRADERSAGNPPEGPQADWRQAVERSLTAKDLPVARWLVDDGPDAGSVPEYLVPDRPRFPYSDPAELVCRWFVGERQRPRDFDDWLPADREVDPEAHELLKALAVLLEAPGALSTAKVARLAHQLEALLGGAGSTGPVPAPVEERSEAFWTVLRDPGSPWLPALGTALYPGGLPLLVTANPVANPGELPFPLAIHLDLLEANPLGERFLRLTPRTLFRYLGDRRHRRHYLLQELGSRIPLDRALPPDAPPADGTLLEGRDRELAQLISGPGCQLVLGPEGVGKTSLVERAARELAGKGWQVFQLRLQERDADAARERLRSALAAWHRSGTLPPEPAGIAPDWVAGLTPERLLITLDDADLLLTSGHRGGGLCELLGSLVDAGEGRIRCWIAGAPILARELAPQFPAGSAAEGALLLGGISQQACHRLLQTLFDYLWVSVRPPALIDRLALCSGGHPKILFLLLRELFTRRRHQGRTAFLDSHVEEAWQAPGFREEATRILVAPLHGRSDLRLALGYVLQLASGEGISQDEIEEFILFHGFTLAVVEELCALRILERSATGRTRFRLPASGLGELIAERFGDGEKLMEEAETELQRARGSSFQAPPWTS